MPAFLPTKHVDRATLGLRVLSRTADITCNHPQLMDGKLWQQSKQN